MDPILTGAAANNSSEAAKGILQEVKRHFRCVTTYKKNVDKFEEKRVKDLEEKAKNKCFIGLCPSIKSRYQLSRRAEKGATALEGLIQKHQFTGSEATDDEPVKDFEAFESRQKVFNDIMEAVKDTSTSMIGLYGIGGAGKSTLLKEIVRQVKKSKLFDCVVSLAIKDIPAIMTIQDQIAELLGLEWKGSTVIARELRLEDGKLLVVLDDLREKLNLKGMGIPFGEEPKRFKILVASRDQDVLRQCEGMYDQNNTFSIGCLDDNDASDLFKKIVGGSINPELQAIGDEIAKRCGGLPLAISAVAQTLRNKNQPAWENALSQLQSPSSTGLKDVSPAVYAALKLCYNHIEGDEVKRFFLLCSLLSHDFLIEVLLRYAIGLGLLPSDYTVEEARDRMSRWECPELTTFVADFVIEDESQVDPNMGKNNSEVDVLCLFNDKTAEFRRYPSSVNSAY
ncbi:Disease resistance protein [Corchorus olitorius]|uniref:Disease resistance protein n=1 Tax=Corchorus olitorius TaxID=93759 RepID=A0A1R3JVU5_9ROSI|nr:Disease resistance protein [Corchorus olitorius]